MLGEKNKPWVSFEKSNSRLGIGEEIKEEEKGEKSRICQECQELRVDFIGGDPFQGMWDI